MCELEATRVSGSFSTNNGVTDRLTEEAKRIKENNNVKVVLKSLGTFLLFSTGHTLTVLARYNEARSFTEEFLFLFLRFVLFI